MSTPEEFDTTPEGSDVKAESAETTSTTSASGIESMAPQAKTSSNRTYIYIAVAVVAVIVIALLAFSGTSNKNVAAKVNGEKIEKAALDEQVAQLQKQYPDMFKGTDGEGRLLDFKQRLLDNLIDQELVAQAAKDRGIQVSDEEVNKQIEQLKAGFKDAAQFQAALKSANMTEESLKEQIRNQLMTQKIIESLSKDVKIAEKDMKSYYDKNKAQFQQQAAKRTSVILFKPQEKDLAEKVLGQLRDGGDFAALAKKYSADSATASKGGDKGWPLTASVGAYEDAVKKLDKGEISDLVRVNEGWYIIKVTDARKASTKTYAEVKSEIEQVLIQQKRADAYQKFLDELRKKAKIEIMIDELKASATPAASKK